jgi:hypothetical protein
MDASQEVVEGKKGEEKGRGDKAIGVCWEDGLRGGGTYCRFDGC